ncbi:MAG: DUF2258 domain-containing protein [Desulfurococcaceae archaeon]|nr:DUF2258 domain-containing protein [Desulfurococcaceae archaeon]
MSTSSETRELSTGLVIAGAYADKVRRTIFAQLRDLVKQDKEFAREAARASAELNMVLYNILVGELKIDKGDVVRIRVNYRVEPEKRITWLYNTLRIEAFKRIPDENVEKIVNNIISTRLEQILERFRVAPREAEKVVKEFEISEEEAERVIKPPPPPTPPTPIEITPPAISPTQIVSEIASIDIIGETAERGFVAKLCRSDGSVLGLVSLTPTSEGEVVVDAIVVYMQKAYRYLARTKKSIELLIEEPQKILEDLSKTTPTEISSSEAQKLIEEKMKSLI